MRKGVRQRAVYGAGELGSAGGANGDSALVLKKEPKMFTKMGEVTRPRRKRLRMCGVSWVGI